MQQAAAIDEISKALSGNGAGRPVYFIGIGGIGMSALARYFASRGFNVSGYDKTVTPLTRQLEAEGMAIHYEDNIAMAPKDAALVVYTPAIPAGHQEWNWYRANSFALLKRSEVLGLISRNSFNICIAGTHGKTTTTTMVAHILRHSGYGCNAFLGGISVNYQTNFWSHERNVCVIEADEYDRSFLHLSPNIAIISSMDADHLDIYGTEQALQDAFVAFAGRIKAGGALLSKLGLQRSSDLHAGRHWTYSLQEPAADVHAAGIQLHEGGYRFSVTIKDKRVDEVYLRMGGMHNIENAVAAITVAHLLGIDHAAIKAAIADFKGVKRRFEYIVPPGANARGIVFIDDYAHHPEELRALISGARSLFSGRQCTVVFQPHLYSRTKDHAAGFASSLDLADEVLLLPIYPARELPIEGVNSGMIAEKMPSHKVSCCTREALLEIISSRMKTGNYPEVLITAGAGDIDMLVQPLKTILEK